MNSRKPIPPGRTLEQVRNQYLVEKEIADRLKSSNREERKIIYRTMYDELFARVPDHSRLKRRRSDQATRSINIDKFSLVERYLDDSIVFAGFAPGGLPVRL